MEPQSVVVTGRIISSTHEMDEYYKLFQVPTNNDDNNTTLSTSLLDRIMFFNTAFPSGISFSPEVSTSLPQTLKRIIFHRNKIDSDKLDVSSLPKDIEWIDFSNNKLESFNLLPVSSNNKGYSLWKSSSSKKKKRDRAPTPPPPPSDSSSPPNSIHQKQDHLQLINLLVIDLSNNCLTRLPDLSLLPPSLERFNISRNKISEKNPDLTNLPVHLEIFNASHNQLSGTVDLTQLPQTIRDVDLSRNSFANNQIPDLNHLPETLTYLDLSYNKFTGSPSLSMLPSGLQILDLSKNKFESTTPSLAASGALQLRRLSMSGCRFGTTPVMDKLPPFIEVLDFSNNKIMVSPTFPPPTNNQNLKIPLTLRMIDFSGNELRGPVPDFSNLPPSCRHIDFSNNELSGFRGCDFSRLPKSLIHLDLSNNKLGSFKGKIDLTMLPRKLEHFDMSNNEIDGELILYNDEKVDRSEDAAAAVSSSSCSTSKFPLGKTIPEYLERILLSGNKIKGTVDLLHLNPHIMRVDLSHNQIENLEGGAQCFKNLPPVLDSVDLTSNKISIENLDLSVLPQNIEKLFLSENCFSGKIDFWTCSKSLKQLFLNSNQLKFFLDLEPIGKLDNLSVLDLSENQLFGILDMKHLARRTITGWKGGSGHKVHSLHLAGNNFAPLETEDFDDDSETDESESDSDDDDAKKHEVKKKRQNNNKNDDGDNALPDDSPRRNDGRLFENQYFSIQF